MSTRALLGYIARGTRGLGGHARCMGALGARPESPRVSRGPPIIASGPSAVLLSGETREGVRSITNAEFATAVDCHITTASRFRNGHRLPDLAILTRIEAAFGLAHEELMPVWLRCDARRRRGQKSHATEFGRFLRRRVFDADGKAA